MIQTLTCHIKTDTSTILLTEKFLRQLNLEEAAAAGYLHFVSDGKLTNVLKKINPIGNVSVCAIHNINRVAERTFKMHLKHEDQLNFKQYESLVEFFKKSRRKDSVAQKSLNEYLGELPEKLTGFHEMVSTRFRSRGENFIKLRDRKEVLITLRQDEEFDCLARLPIEKGAAIGSFLVPLHTVLCILDSDEGNSAGSMFHAYTHLHYVVQRGKLDARLSVDESDLIKKLNECLKRAIYEQMFEDYKAPRTPEKIKGRMTPVDCAAVYLFPPTRFVLKLCDCPTQPY